MKNLKGMCSMLKLTTHEEVIKEVLKYSKDKFTVFRGDTWTVLLPKVTKHKYLPMVTAHTDTVNNTHPTKFKYVDSSKKYIRNADNKLIGADDRLGCWIVQQLIQTNAEDFIFGLFDFEEVGGIGSGDFADTQIFKDVQNKISCFIGLDRKGNDELALYGYESEEFLHELQKIRGFHTDIGSFTDVAMLAQASSISCVNMSIGYYNEHTKKEKFSPKECENTLKVMQSLPKTLWNKQYICEYVYDSTSHYLDTYITEICDYCGLHTTNWGIDTNGMVICDDCKDVFYMEDEKDLITLIHDIIKSKKGSKNKKAWDINIISYFVRYKEIKQPQVKKIKKICVYYNLKYEEYI